MSAAEVRLELDLELLGAMLLDLDPGNPDIQPDGQLVDPVQGIAHMAAGDAEQVGIIPARHQLALEPLKEHQRYQDADGSDEGDGVVPASGGHTQAGHGPHAGGGGQTLDGGALLHDGARTQKAHAGNHLGTEPGGIRGGPIGPVLGKQGLTCNHHRAGTQGHQHMGTHTGGPMGILPLRADDHADEHGAQHPQGDFPGCQSQRGQIHGGFHRKETSFQYICLR